MKEFDCCWIAGIEAIEASRRRRLRRLWRQDEHDVDDEREDELELCDRAEHRKQRARETYQRESLEVHSSLRTYISMKHGDVYSLTGDRCHVYDVPTTARYRLALDRFYRRNQSLPYSSDSLTFDRDRVLGRSVFHYRFLYPSSHSHRPVNR